MDELREQQANASDQEDVPAVIAVSYVGKKKITRPEVRKPFDDRKRGSGRPPKARKSGRPPKIKKEMSDEEASEEAKWFYVNGIGQ